MAFMNELCLSFLLVLIWCPLFDNASETVVQCPKQQIVELGKRGIVGCDVQNFSGVYWYDTTNEMGATAFIQMENRTVVGSGYNTGEFDILLNGSLVITAVSIHHENTYQAKFLTPDLIINSYEVTVTVYAEPTEPKPVIPQCDGKIPCIQQGDPQSAILCVHENSRPAAELSWFMRIEGNDVLLNATTNLTMSTEAMTFTTQSSLLMSTIPAITTVNPLVLLVCKSSHPVTVTGGSESHVLIDFSRKYPFSNGKGNDVHSIYMTEGGGVTLACHSGSRLSIASNSTIMLWMYKSVNNENLEYLMYSAYGDVVSNLEANTIFDMATHDSLVIKQIDRTHEGYYACLKSTEDRTISVTHLIKIIVLPNPPTILVDGCELFQPCHLIVQPGESITCSVNGVRPDVSLKIVDGSPHGVISRTDTESHRENGLFYATIRGYFGVSRDICGENVTVMCQAIGQAASGFKSGVHITATVVEDYYQTTAVMIPEQEDHFPLAATIILDIILIIVTIIIGISVFIAIWKRLSHQRPSYNMVPMREVRL